MDVPHTVLNHSLMDRHLSCSQFGAIINKTSMNIHRPVSGHMLLFPLCIYLIVECLDHMVGLGLTF